MLFKKAAIAMIFIAAVFAPATQIHVEEYPGEIEMISSGFNGTTWYMLYRANDVVYVCSKEGYGKIEQGIWYE